MDFKCDELISEKTDADSRALTYIAALYMCVMFKTFGCGVGERHIFNCESGKKVAQLCLNKEKEIGRASCRERV